MFLKNLAFLFLALSFVACTKKSLLFPKSVFVLEGALGQEATLFSIHEDKKKQKKTYIPLSKVSSRIPLELEHGAYLIANECSSTEFEHSADTKIYLSSVTFSPAKSLEDSTEGGESTFMLPGDGGLLETRCTDPVDGSVSTWNSKTRFAILPGKSHIVVSGREVTLDNKNEPTSKNLEFEIYPMKVKSVQKNGDEYFYIHALQEDEDQDQSISSAPVQNDIWFLPGKYQLEINGTHQTIEVSEESPAIIPLGLLRVERPKFLQKKEASSYSTQLSFVQVNDEFLFSLDHDYSIFPGIYNIAFESTDIKTKVTIQPNQEMAIKTRAAAIHVPPCPTNKKCKGAPRVTVHNKFEPYALGTFEAGQIFLVFEGDYSFGVGGIRGIQAELHASADEVKTHRLARVKLNWKIEQNSPYTLTERVRVESHGGGLFGRSLDLMFDKPSEIFLPAGQFFLSYYVGIGGNLDPRKQRNTLDLRENSFSEFTIPIYSQKTHKTEAQTKANTQQPAEEAQPDKEQDSPVQKIPTRLSPIRK